MLSLVTRFNGGLGHTRLQVVPDNLRGRFQPKWFYNLLCLFLVYRNFYRGEILATVRHLNLLSHQLKSVLLTQKNAVMVLCDKAIRNFPFRTNDALKIFKWQCKFAPSNTYFCTIAFILDTTFSFYIESKPMINLLNLQICY